MTKKWFATVNYYSKDHGYLDVDFAVDTGTELDQLIKNSLVGASVTEIKLIPYEVAALPTKLPPSLEALIQRLEEVEDIKHDALEGAERRIARSHAPSTLAGDRANEQTDGQKPDETAEDSGSDRSASRFFDLGHLLGGLGTPVLGTG